MMQTAASSIDNGQASCWLPLLPLPLVVAAAAACVGQVQQSYGIDSARSNNADNTLPAQSCGIEAVRTAFTPFPLLDSARSRKRKLERNNVGDDYSKKPFQLCSKPSCFAEIVMAQSRDLVALAKLHSDNLPVLFPIGFLFPLLFAQNSFALVAHHPSMPNRILGCITVRLDAAKQTLHIMTLCVDESARRSGLATRLIDDAIVAAERSASLLSCRIRIVTLQVQTSNTAAIRFYVCKGFRQVGVMKRGLYRGARWGGADGIDMERYVC